VIAQYHITQHSIYI